MKNLLTKTLLGTMVAGITGFGILSWTGQTDLEAIKTKFDYVMENYQNALVNIDNYRTALRNKVKDIENYETIQADLMKQIEDLKAQIKVLESSNADNEENKALIAQYEQQIAELQEQLDSMATDEDVQTLLDEITRLQNELTKANTEVAELRSYVDAQSDITPTTIETVEDIEKANFSRNPLLTFEMGIGWDSVSSQTQSTIVNALNSLEIPDSFKESPVILHQGGNNGQFYTIFINSEQAYNRLVANENYVDGYGFYILNGQFITQEESINQDFINVTFTLATDEQWLGFGYTELDHN